MQLLAISGSLRATSSNTTLLKAATTLAPENVEIRVYQGLGDLPHFDPDLDGPDLDGEEALSPVRDFRAQLKVADGVLISSLEYAHGVPGVLKNALAGWSAVVSSLANQLPCSMPHLTQATHRHPSQKPSR
ncbi:NAD(P)H-dependent oxidoreductase [Leptolyngbya sp. FACHB-261]|uniref:NADPH-dependent FMN reductase n=1 Tax=Leptolyngbya sp. FACHB-261 TaxID=2692806 RepID=UPI0018EF6ADD